MGYGPIALSAIYHQRKFKSKGLVMDSASPQESPLDAIRQLNSSHATPIFHMLVPVARRCQTMPPATR